METLRKQERLLLLAPIAYVNDPSLLRTARSLSQCRPAKKTGEQRKTESVSERKKKSQQDSGLHTSHKRIDLFTKAKFLLLFQAVRVRLARASKSRR